MKEYRIAIGWAIFAWVFSIAIFIVFGVIILSPLIPGLREDFGDEYFTLLPIGLVLIAICILGLLDLRKSKLVLHDDRIESFSLTSHRSLRFDEMKGYEVTDKYVWIYPKDKSKKKIRFSSYISRYSELMDTLAAHIPDLVQEKEEEEIKEVLNNDAFGITEEDRADKLERARNISKYLNGASFVTGAWALFYPKPYELAMWSAAVLPLVSILYIWLNPGLLRVNSHGGYPNLIMALFGPAFVLFLRGMMDFNVLDAGLETILSVGIGIGLTVMTLLGTRELKGSYLSRIGIALFCIVCFSAYGFGFSVFINCAYDKSPATEYQAEVLSKRESSGKSHSYYLELSPWGSMTEADEVEVTANEYDYFEEGDELTVYQKNGALGVRWYYIGERMDKL